jgi:hypothetical protein
MTHSAEVGSPRDTSEVPLVSAFHRPLMLVPIALAASLAATVGAASAAEPRDPAGGEWLFREGRALMKKGDFLSACPKLEESLRLDPAVGTLMNLAECEERIGRTASAWQRWGAAADQLPVRDRRRETALGRARTLEKGLARLTIKLGASAPPTARVLRDGLLLGEPSLGVPLPVDPGIHWIVVTAPGREGREVQVRLEVGEQRVVEVEPGASTPRPRAVTAGTPPATGADLITPFPAVDLSAAAASRPARGGRAMAVGYLLVAGGAAALATGGYFALQALAARRDARAACTEAGGVERCWSNAAVPLDRDRRASLLADVGFVVGALAGAGGVYLLVRESRSRSSSSSSPSAATWSPGVRAMVGVGRVELAGTF